MTTTLITGANKGIGYETARQLVAAGHTVYIGSRNLESGERAAKEAGARAVQLDVTRTTTPCTLPPERSTPTVVSTCS